MDLSRFKKRDGALVDNEMGHGRLQAKKGRGRRREMTQDWAASGREMGMVIIDVFLLRRPSAASQAVVCVGRVRI